ncbi:hypothetical protein D1BOALGB6SA_4610 [Olavius sp. associated proteobacterium Delta 1]|nr:hypothetical protein D1BOALGB6SA_4610 [Olavius sp. associated proteobacterium Delta 1]
MRNLNPFTDRQIRLLEAVREKIRAINDPNSDIITNESYEFSIKHTKQFGKIPKIGFKPRSGQIKAELAHNSDILDKSRDEEIARLRRQYGVTEARNREARLFESEWNNIMLKAKKATFTLALINQLFTTNSQSIADPVEILQQIVMDEYAQVKVKREPIIEGEAADAAEKTENGKIKSYAQELAELE